RKKRKDGEGRVLQAPAPPDRGDPQKERASDHLPEPAGLLAHDDLRRLRMGTQVCELRREPYLPPVPERTRMPLLRLQRSSPTPVSHLLIFATENRRLRYRKVGRRIAAAISRSTRATHGPRHHPYQEKLR